MDPARPLHEVFADLTGAGIAGDPAELLRDSGHSGLPDDLVAEAVVSYADTAPAEVAEHLAPYVTAHSAVGADDVPSGAPDWPALLATAPSAPAPDEFDDVAPLSAAPGEDVAPVLDFGTGATTAAEVTVDDAVEFDDLGAPEEIELPADPADLDRAVLSDATDEVQPDDDPDIDPLV